MQIDYIRLSRVFLRIAAHVRFARYTSEWIIARLHVAGARGIKRGEVVIRAIFSLAVSSQAVLGNLPSERCRVIPRR
jgi:hypothetical protein